MNDAYWSNFGGLTTTDYVSKFVEGSEIDRVRMLDTIKALPEGVETLLDVGCGFGHFASLVREQRGISTVGVEITPEKVNYAKTALGVNAAIASIDALPFSDRSFDAVSVLEVLEHLPVQVFCKGCAEIARVASKWILVSVPWRERRQNVVCSACGCGFNPNRHLRSFHDESFPSLFDGFELRRLEAMGERRDPPSWWLKARRPVWPAFAVCPACGWQRSAKIETLPAVGRPQAMRTPFAAFRAGVRRWVSASHPCWYLAVFQRKVAG